MNNRRRINKSKVEYSLYKYYTEKIREENEIEIPIESLLPSTGEEHRPSLRPALVYGFLTAVLVFGLLINIDKPSTLELVINEKIQQHNIYKSIRDELENLRPFPTQEFSKKQFPGVSRFKRTLFKFQLTC